MPTFHCLTAKSFFEKSFSHAVRPFFASLPSDATSPLRFPLAASALGLAMRRSKGVRKWEGIGIVESSSREGEFGRCQDDAFRHERGRGRGRDALVEIYGLGGRGRVVMSSGRAPYFWAEKYSFDEATPGLIVDELPSGFQLAGQTSPFSSVNWKA